MKRPSAVPALMLFGVVVALAACNAHDPHAPATRSISEAQAFVCWAYVRPSVEAQPQPLGEITMSEPGDRSVSSPAFRFRVVYDDDRYGGRALSTYVYSNSTGKLIEHSLFQLHREKNPANEFIGGHGFTGLRYVNAPDSAAELQYSCSYR